MANINHRSGRGCQCANCVKRREKAKDYYYRKKNGLLMERRPTAMGKPTGPSSRLHEIKRGDNMTVHWLPKLENPEDEWTCPVCERQFIKTNALSGNGETVSWEMVA